MLVCSLGEQREASTSVCKAETVTEKEGFTWKGHKSLELRSGALQLPSGFQPTVVLQISPPASITSLSLAKQWASKHEQMSEAGDKIINALGDQVRAVSGSSSDSLPGKITLR